MARRKAKRGKELRIRLVDEWRVERGRKRSTFPGVSEIPGGELAPAKGLDC